jgi:hypothetical protein
LVILGCASLLLSVIVSILSSSPWSLLGVAVICLILAFPRFLAKHIELIKAGGFEVRTREAIPAEPRPSAADVEDLARRLPREPATTSLSKHRFFLTELRTAGVAMRNQGIELKLDQLGTWLAGTKKWTEITVTAIEAVDKADAEWFRTLDAVPPPRIPFHPINRNHEKAYRELDLMLEKLGTLIVRYAQWDRPSN